MVHFGLCYFASKLVFTKKNAKMIIVQLDTEQLNSIIENAVRNVLDDEKNQMEQAEQEPQFLTIGQAAEFLNLTIPTIYSKVSKGELPFMKRSKRLYFSKSELLQYIKEGRRKTNYEIEQEAQNFVSLNKKGLNNGK